MRQRITYILQDEDFNPAERLKVTSDALAITGLKGVKEHQLTTSLDELPPTINLVLQDCHELHFRWATPRPYKSIAPFTSRVSPGLHVFFTPLKDKRVDHLCTALNKIFGYALRGQCIEPRESFISPPVLSDRFSNSPTRHYYQYLPTLTDVALWIEHVVCKVGDEVCKQHARELEFADYLDADYDSITHTFTMRALWSRSQANNGLWTTTHKGTQEQTVEVGVLMNEKPSEPEILKFSGWLTVPGIDSKPSQTMFETPARHHSLPGNDQISFKATAQKPTGMHPVLQLTFKSDDLVAPSPSCALHTYLTLPSTLIFDRYPFFDALFLQSHGLKSLRTLSGATDLEAPVWTVKQWGSAALLELAAPAKDASASTWNVTVPLHLRYMSPNNDTSGLAQTYVPWPTVFWACTAEEGTKFTTSPFDRVNLGYDHLFGPRTMFYHIPPSTDVMAREVIDVPVMNLNNAAWAEMGTIAVISLGSLYIFAQLLWSLWAQQRYNKTPTPKKKQ